MNGSGSKFADPFLMASSDYIPDNVDSALDFCGFLYYLNPQYQMASRRVVSHFVTDVEFEGEDGDTSERVSFREFLVEKLKLKNALISLGDEWAAYGNGFFRIHFPFDRFLVDSRDGRYSQYSLDMFGEGAKFDLATMTYEVRDPRKPSTKETVKLSFIDKKSFDCSRIRLIRLDPRRIRTMPSHISGRIQYIFRFEEWFVQQVMQGRLHQVNETPICMLQVIKEKKDFLFNEDEVFHLAAPSISGVSNAGWGLPPTMANYRSLHQLQVYRKIDEAIGLDYMIPFRMFSPNLSGQMTDPTVQLILSEWMGNVKQVIQNRRKDPTAMHALPFPVNYQEFGAQGKQYVPKDLIEFQTNDMLDGMGYPAELFRGTLSVQQVPTTMRLFENTFSFLHTGFDSFVKWVARRTQGYLNQEAIKVTLQLPKIADNMERQYLFMQLVASGEISRARAFEALGIKDPVEEAGRRMDEDLGIEKVKVKKSKQFEKETQAGDMGAVAAQAGASPGSAPGSGPAGGPQVTPLDVQSQAQETASQLLQMEEGDRRKEMDKIRATDPVLYATVKQQMEQMRSQAGSQGRAQAGQQQGDQPQ